ncbi:ABC transporter ATP-binding protein [Agrobacterium sp. ES01]|uniref:ABC transporter ATP-binding protein n=1 Tax=Agrobacterium sp. ES01 TaxID=3420714 RepID=UPI003D0BD807
MPPIISIQNLSKTYDNGFSALKDVSIDIEKGEIVALLGPNGAGKTTLISIVCGVVNPSGGTVLVGGHDVVKEFRKTRAVIGLVPQELTTDQFETVFNTVTFSRGLHGKRADPAYIEDLLKSLSLWDKRDSALRELSGGMKRRVLIAKALSHQPDILFLDEPTAGVDVALRKDMWRLVGELRRTGVTIILTTHYIEEAQEIADRIGIINKGELLLIEQKDALMHKLGRKQMVLELAEPIDGVPEALSAYHLNLSEDRSQLIFEYDQETNHGGVAGLLAAVEAAGVRFLDISTSQTSLEDIFVSLIGEKA